MRHRGVLSTGGAGRAIEGARGAPSKARDARHPIVALTVPRRRRVATVTRAHAFLP
jgi:hypothetical protein